MLLTGHKSKPFLQFKEKLLNVVDNCFFKFRFNVAVIIGKSKKFKNCGIFDKFQPVLKISRLFLISAVTMSLFCEDSSR
jgi:hypothetical protein